MALSLFVVTDFGPLPDNATPAILAAIEAARAAGGGVVYFPAGEYLIGDSPEDDRHIHVSGAQCLTFLGDGPCSVLRRDASNPEAGIFLFQRCSDIVLSNLALDADGFEPPFGAPQRALAQFELCTKVRVQRVLAKDSNPTPRDLVDPSVLTHRYDSAQHTAFGFYGDDSADGSADLQVTECELQTLGIAVHGGSRVRIAHNVVRSALGNGIAVGARSAGQIHQDVAIADNLVTDAWAFGIVVADLAPEGVDATMRRISIENNRVSKSGANYRRAIVAGVLGAGDAGSSGPCTHAGIRIVRNVVDLGPGEPLADDGSPELAERAIVGGIWLRLPPPAEDISRGPGFGATPAFVLARITDNLITGARSEVSDVFVGLVAAPPGVGILGTNLSLAEIGGNGIFESDEGIALEGLLVSSHVHDNRFMGASSRAYRVDRSLGGNQFNSNVTMAQSGETARASDAIWIGDLAELDRLLGGDRKPRDEGLRAELRGLFGL